MFAFLIFIKTNKTLNKHKFQIHISNVVLDDQDCQEGDKNLEGDKNQEGDKSQEGDKNQE